MRWRDSGAFNSFSLQCVSEGLAVCVTGNKMLNRCNRVASMGLYGGFTDHLFKK